MRWPARVKSRAFSEPPQRSKAAEPAPRGPVVQELEPRPDARDNPTERVLFQLGTLPSELRSAILHHGPCRPKGHFAISSENGALSRKWFCFSPTMQKPSCQSCLLFGRVIGRFFTNHICPRRYVTKRSDMFQNYMDDLSQFCLVLGQFVTLLFWTICHKSYLS